MLKNKRILGVILAVMLVFSVVPMGLAADDNPSNITMDDVNELLRSYGLVALSQEEVDILGLGEGGTNPLNVSSLEELEEIIVNAMASIPNEPINYSYDVNIELDPIRARAGSGTNKVTTTQYFVCNPYNDLVLDHSIAVTYQYDYVQYNGDPATISNLRYTSWGGARIIQRAGEWSRLSTVYSTSVSKISDTNLRQSFSILVDEYMNFSIDILPIWIKVGSNPHNGSIDYYIRPGNSLKPVIES